MSSLGPRSPPCRSRQHRVRCSKGMAIEKIEMVEDPDATLSFVSEICTMIGSRFLRRFGLLVLYV